MCLRRRPPPQKSTSGKSSTAKQPSSHFRAWGDFLARYFLSALEAELGWEVWGELGDEEFGDEKFDDVVDEREMPDERGLLRIAKLVQFGWQHGTDSGDDSWAHERARALAQEELKDEFEADRKLGLERTETREETCN
jgi:hypothetical protein